jgi:hypothetical protein
MRSLVLILLALLSLTAKAQTDTLMDSKYDSSIHIVPKYDDVYNSGFESFYIPLEDSFKLELLKHFGSVGDTNVVPIMTAVICVEPDGHVSKYRLVSFEIEDKLYYVDRSVSDMELGRIDSCQSIAGNKYASVLWNMGIKEVEKYPWVPAYSNGKPIRSWHFFMIDFEEFIPEDYSQQEDIK